MMEEMDKDRTSKLVSVPNKKIPRTAKGTKEGKYGILVGSRNS